jgi:hypothetical protein
LIAHNPEGVAAIVVRVFEKGISTQTGLRYNFVYMELFLDPNSNCIGIVGKLSQTSVSDAIVSKGGDWARFSLCFRYIITTYFRV